jgi:hypothetical protein
MVLNTDETINGIDINAGAISDVTTLGMSGQLTSTLAIGTSPFAVTSTTVNTNLNADLWDGYQFASYLNQAVLSTSSPTFAGLTLNGSLTLGANTLTTTNTNVVTNLNADMIDGLHSSNFAREYQANISGISNAGWTNIAYINGSGLNSKVRLTMGGTTGSVVVNLTADILVGHSTNIYVRTESGGYTQVTLRITSNGDEDFYIQAQTNSANVLTADCRVYTFGGEVVTMAPASVSGATVRDHIAYLHKLSISGGGQTAAGMNIDGQISSTLAIGTAPFAVTSTTVNTNLNADLWDGYQFASYLNQAVLTTSSPTFSRVYTTGRSAGWGSTNGVDTGGMNVTMGTGDSATWLLSGTSGGVFRAGIQSLDSNGQLMIYSGSSSIGINGNTISMSGQLTNTVATGTSPFAISSTTVNTNLNADLWDGYQFASYLNQAVLSTSSPTFASLTLTNDLTVANGGTGASTFSANYLLKGNGASAISSSQIYDNGTNVGIGATNNGGDGGVAPRLTIADPSNADKFVGIGFNDAGDYGFIHSVHRATAWKNLVIQGFGGNVGIGTTIAGKLLDVAGEIRGATRMTVYSGATQNALSISGSTIDLGLEINNSGTSGRNYQLLSTNSGSGVAAGSLRIYDATAGLDRIVVNSAGNVGIGTTSPLSRLDIMGSYEATHGGRTLIGDGGGWDPTIRQYRWAGSASLYGASRMLTGFDGGSYPTMYLQVASAQANMGSESFVDVMSLHGNGNVGIGTTGPGAKLEVYGAGQLTAALTDAGMRTDMLAINSNTASGNSGGAIIFGNIQSASAGSIGMAAIKALLQNGDGNTSGDLAFSTRNSSADTALTERLRILAGGNVGIGTTNPTSGLLDVRGVISSGDGTIKSALSYTGTTGVVGTLSNHALGIYTNLAERIRIDTSGNVGIGTTSPGAKLDVIDSQRWTYSGEPEVYHLHLDEVITAGVVRWSFSQRNSNTDYNNMLVLDRGNIGIGTTDPGQKLDVFGVIRSSTGGLEIGKFGVASNPRLSIGLDTNQFSGSSIINGWNNSSNTGISIGTIRSDGVAFNVVTGATVDANYLPSTAGTTAFTVLGNGNVGIGTSSPTLGHLQINSGDTTAGLYVRGGDTGIGSAIANFVDYNSNSKLYIRGDGNVGIGTTSPGARLEILDTTKGITDGNVRITASESLAADMGGAIAFRGAYTSGGAVGTFGSISGKKVNAVSSDVRGYLQFGVTNTWGTTNEVMRIVGDTSGGTGGNVGIGTTSPGVKLDVRGSIIAANSDYVNGSVGSMLQIQQGASSGNTYSSIGAYSAGGTNWNNLVLQSGGGNVGIGTTSPWAPLHVSGATSEASLVHNDPATAIFGVNAWTSLALTNSVNSPYTISLQTRNSGSDGSSYPLALNPLGGNVGIGTTSPNAKLHVGTAPSIISNISTTAVLATSATGSSFPLTIANTASQSNNDTATISFAFGANWSATASMGAIIENNSTAATGLVLSTFNGSLTEKVRIANDGNVGIGTTSPGALLHLGKSGAAAELWLQRTDGYTAVKLYGGALTDGNGFKINVNGSDRFAIDSSGNVGIGTTAPAYQLDVAGSSRVTGALYANANGAAYLCGGDDACLYDVNVSNTVGIIGAQNSDRGYIQFGSGGGSILGAINASSLTYNDNVVWHAGNDGSGSGLDADLIDGIDSGSLITTSNIGSQSVNYATSAGTATNAGLLYTNTGAQNGSLQYWQLNNNSTLNPDTSYYYALRMGHGDADTYYSGTLAFSFFDDGGIYWRRKLGGVDGNWIRMWNAANDGSASGLDADLIDGIDSGNLITTSNIGSQSVNYATSAGNADTVDSVHAGSFIRTDAAGDWQLASNNNSSSYQYTSLEVRELNFAGAQTGADSEAPRIGFHWGNRATSQIGMNASGLIRTFDNPGTGYANFAAADIQGNTFMARGANPFYFQDYGGGFYMNDSNWIRTYGGKNIWTDSGLLGSDGGLTVGNGGAAPPSGGAIIAGNVGIGTTSPGVKLDVRGKLGINTTPSSSYADLQMAGDIALNVGEVASTTRHIGIQNGDANWNRSSIDFIMDSSTNTNVGIYGFQSGVSRNLGLYVRYDGNVGIGTTNPAVKLDINGAVNVGGTLTMTNGDIDMNGYQVNDAYMVNVGGGGITSSGSVSIGTTSPGGAKLLVIGNSTSTAWFTNTAASSSGAGAGMIGFSDDGAALASGDRMGFFLLGGARDASHTMSNSAGIGGYAAENWSGTSSASYLTFETTSTGTTTRSERMRIDSAGNVGIGTTSPGAKLHVYGNARVGDGAAAYIDLTDDESPNGIKYIHANANNIGFLSGAASWLTRWDDAGNQINTGTITASQFNGSGAGLTGTASSLTAGYATTFSTDRTNYFGVTNGAVAGQLMWKNYANNHTIFDASASTSPSGSSISDTNAQVAWSATYPTLMGWNGANTYGVRVDSARVSDNADLIDGIDSGSLITTSNIGSQTVSNVTSLSGIWDSISYFRSNKGASSYLGSNSGYALEAYSTDGGAAAMSFHRSGAYAVNMGLDPDNVFRIGGWSAGANVLQLDMSGNLTVAGTVDGYDISTYGAYFIGSAGTSGQVWTSDGSGAGAWAAAASGMPSGTEGQMLYNNAGTWTSFSSMYWDDTNSRLGIGTTTPSAKLDIFGTTNSMRLSYSAAVYSQLATLSTGELQFTGSYATDSAMLIGSGTAIDQLILFDGNTRDFYVGQDDTDDFLKIGSGAAVGSNTYLTINGSGNVGIGVTNPATYKFYVDWNSDGASPAYVNNSNAWTNGSADYAEFFKTNDPDLSPGEAVCVDINNSNAVKRCQRAEDPDLMGIVSTSPSVLGNAEPGREFDKNYVIVGMLGQVPAKVSTENGQINPGDSLTAATKPGTLMKANAGDSTVGVALEPIQQGEGSIQVLISRRNKSLTVEKVEEEVSQRIAEMDVEDQVNQMITQAQTQLNESINSQTTVISDLTSQLTQTSNKITTLQEQMDLIKQQNQTILDFALALDIEKLIYKDESGNLDLKTGKLITAEVVAGAFTVKVTDENNKTIGESKIKAITKDEDNDGKDDETGSDGKSVVVKTGAVSGNSKVFVTPMGEELVKWSISEIKPGEGFKIIIDKSASGDISFNWWIIEGV